MTVAVLYFTVRQTGHVLSLLSSSSFTSFIIIIITIIIIIGIGGEKRVFS
jgi:hypothetical protein